MSIPMKTLPKLFGDERVKHGSSLCCGSAAREFAELRKFASLHSFRRKALISPSSVTSPFRQDAEELGPAFLRFPLDDCPPIGKN